MNKKNTKQIDAKDNKYGPLDPDTTGFTYVCVESHECEDNCRTCPAVKHFKD